MCPKLKTSATCIEIFCGAVMNKFSLNSFNSQKCYCSSRMNEWTNGKGKCFSALLNIYYKTFMKLEKYTGSEFTCVVLTCDSLQHLFSNHFWEFLLKLRLKKVIAFESLLGRNISAQLWSIIISKQSNFNCFLSLLQCRQF